MQLNEILAHLPDETLDQLARDKLDEVSNVRLPRPVVEQEIAAALSSFAYIADVLAASRPPTYAFIKLLMEAENFSVPAAGFREAVLDRTNRITEWIDSGEGLPAGKDYGFYRRMLLTAWEDGGAVDPSEARLLEAIRVELGLGMREHLMLEHHPEVRPIWDSPKSFEHGRNYLLARGLVLTVDDRFVLPDEVRLQVRRYWGMELHDASYRHLLEGLTGNQLRGVLEATGLALSGSKDERVERIVAGLVTPSAALNCLSIQELKDISRSEGLAVSLQKSDLITQLVHHFDQPLQQDTELESEPEGEFVDEPARQLDDESLAALLVGLSLNQLYEVLGRLWLPRTGSKGERVQRLVESPFAETTMLRKLRRSDLAKLSRQRGLQVSGPKDELIERLLGSAPADREADADQAAVIEMTMPSEVWKEAPAAPADGEELEVVPASEPAGLREVRAEYHGLGYDEHVILTLLREARSLNERDIERLATRHHLGWFLTKAHMAELLGKLASTGRSPVRVRSTGAANIYEWVDDTQIAEAVIDRWAARDVIDALRQGVVPESNLELLVVGQEAARLHLTELLGHVANGRSAFKFIRGAYGSGKSFFCSWLRDRALNAGFATSTVRVSAELSLADLAVFFSAVMEGLRTPEKRSASAFSDVLESWLLAMQRRAAQTEGLAASRSEDRKRLARRMTECIREELSHLAAHDPGLAPALGAFYDARLEGDQSRAMAARAWLRGERSLAASSLRQIGVRGALEPEQVLPRLRAFLEIIAASHLHGLVVLVDEVELVRRRPHRRERDQAYETLRALIDEVGQNRLPGCLLVFTGTDTFFEDRQYGLASYEALVHRLREPETVDVHRSMRQPVIRLDGLDEGRLLEVALRVREIHGKAYDWSAAERVTDAAVEALVAKWTDFGGEGIDRLPRPCLRQMVHILDLCEENPSLDAMTCLGDPEDDPEASEAVLRLVAN